MPKKCYLKVIIMFSASVVCVAYSYAKLASTLESFVHNV